MNAPATAVPSVSLVEMKFRFKKDKMGNQRPTVELKNVPVPNENYVITILERGGKELKLLLEVMAGTVRSAAASLVSDDEKVTAENFPMEKVTWEAIANQERAERATISTEVWEAFAKEYLEIMPALTNKSAEQLGNAIQVYLKKFAIIKTNKKVLEKLKEQLTIFVENTKNGEDFADIIELLQGKLELYLNSNDVELLVANL
jgi:hypothetical protein